MLTILATVAFTVNGPTPICCRDNKYGTIPLGIWQLFLCINSAIKWQSLLHELCKSMFISTEEHIKNRFILVEPLFNNDMFTYTYV